MLLTFNINAQTFMTLLMKVVSFGMMRPWILIGK